MARQRASASQPGQQIRSAGLYSHNIDLSCFLCKNQIKAGKEYGFVNDFKVCRPCWEKVEDD